MQYLVVTDYDERGWDNLERVLDKLRAADALGAIEEMEPVTTPKGAKRETKRIAFDDDKVRNTHAHGWASNAGYVAHIDHTGHWYTR